MEQYRNKKGLAPICCKRGFTLVEVMISGTILVIAMALIAVFFVKAQKIRSAVTKENNTQVIANGQMMNGAIFGIGQSSDGLMYATKIKAIDTSSPSLWIVFANYTNSNNYVRLRIGLAPAGATNTLYQEIGLRANGLPPLAPPLTPWILSTLGNLDPNDKISLVASDSYFRYYNVVSGTPLDPATLTLSEISQVEICLSIKDKNLPDSLPFVLRNTVTLKNIPHID